MLFNVTMATSLEGAVINVVLDARSVIQNDLCNDGNTSDDIKQNLSLFREFLWLIPLHIEMLRGIRHGGCCIILIVLIIRSMFSLSVSNFSYPTDMNRATKRLSCNMMDVQSVAK